MAEVIAFPLARRVGYVRKQGQWYAEQAPKAAESNLRRQMQVQLGALLNRGVDPSTAEREVQALEAAIRCEVWRVILTPGGAA